MQEIQAASRRHRVPADSRRAESWRLEHKLLSSMETMGRTREGHPEKQNQKQARGTSVWVCTHTWRERFSGVDSCDAGGRQVKINTVDGTVTDPGRVDAAT